MLLTIDLGNTCLKLAIYETNERIAFQTYDTYQDDFKAITKNLLYRNNLKEDVIEDTIVSSVVPNLNKRLIQDIVDLTGKEPIIIDPKNYYGIKIATPDTEEVGSDILVTCAYAYHLLKRELIIVSMGTATVLSHVNEDGAFCHCIIAPGYNMVASTLWTNAAKLPEFELKRTTNFLTNNTIDAMNTGIYQGYVGAIRYLLAGMTSSLQKDPIIVACGGFGKEVVKDIKEIKYYEPDMVTNGLQYLYYRYIKQWD